MQFLRRKAAVVLSVLSFILLGAATRAPGQITVAPVELPAHKAALLAKDGKADLALPMALNQPLGKHTVTITDVISGEQARVDFEVKPE
jgi:hypothetical protein